MLLVVCHYDIKQFTLDVSYKIFYCTRNFFETFLLQGLDYNISSLLNKYRRLKILKEIFHYMTGMSTSLHRHPCQRCHKICLLVGCFSSHLRIVHSGDITITIRAEKFYLYSALMTAVMVLQHPTPTVTRVIRLYLQGPVTPTPVAEREEWGCNYLI